MVSKIAVVGSGISGLVAAYFLSRSHDVHVFEAADYIGGHTHTVDVEVPSGRYAIDTGFIVFNDWTYPTFIRLIDQLGVASKPTEMSFSVKAEATGLEYNGTDLKGLFAQRSNVLRPSFLRMLGDILRFNRQAVSDLLSTDDALTLGQYLEQRHYSESFKNNYIIPMGAAIWSASEQQMLHFPFRYFVRFFNNHGMLNIGHRPTWRVIQGGSRSYIPPLTRGFADHVHLRTPVRSIRRATDHVVLALGGEVPQEAVFDDVVMACHSDQALTLLSDSSVQERAILGAFGYQRNHTVLHTDTRVLPTQQRAWAAWNYWIPRQQQSHVAVTSNMNILQGISAPESFNVSLNLDGIAPANVLQQFEYHHPVYSVGAVLAQTQWAQISGTNRTHFCGAYWGYGFHEDGVKSGVRVAEALGERW